MEQTIEEYINQQIADGYITNKGVPIKCQYCDSTALREDSYHEEHVVVEKLVTCIDCSAEVGLWSYGTWTI